MSGSRERIHPRVNLTPRDVQRARRNIETHSWAGEYARDVIGRADAVVDRDAEWIRASCPGKGAAFACGKTGCPICGAKWTRSGGWGGWGAIDCSFERPGTVRCDNGHILPDADHPDAGTGFVGKEGRIHYFVGSYNAWVVETYQEWCKWLSFAYAITNEERYAETCATLLDVLAEIYPHCDKGSWDYPSDPPSGRLCRPWYQTARVLVLLVDYTDRICGSPALDAPSCVDGMTRRENIEAHMLVDGAEYCYEQSLNGGMHNGEADYLRGAMAVGCLLDVEKYVDWAVDGPFGIRAMVLNNADRDGRYYETSLMYAIHARSLYLTFAEPLVNYRSERYPDGLNLYDDPIFRSFYALPDLSMDCAGHSPRYGDSPPDVSKEAPPERPFSATDHMYAERILSRATDPEVRRMFGGLVGAMAGGDLDAVRAASPDREWLLFHGAEAPEIQRDLPEGLERLISGPTLMGQKGVAILRTPRGESAQACLLRYGPVLNHGHLDDLNINYFGLGYELTYDLGYGDGATHTQTGWSRLTASHQLVMVDERSQLGDPRKDDSGGSLNLFAEMPGLQVVDADAPNVYRSRGVDVYRRFLALVGDGPESYLLDIFRVEGGEQHDYMAHALSDDVELRGISLGDREDGSVAGPDTNWGERQLADGYIRDVPRENGWVPPPGNGLGFLMHPRRGVPEGPWSATWRLPDGDRFLRMTMVPEEGTEVVHAWAPGIFPDVPRAEHVMARRASPDGCLKSSFIAIREPFGPKLEGDAEPFVERVERVPASNGALGLAVHHVDGKIDQFVYIGTPAGQAASGEAELEGCFGHVRRDGDRVALVHLIGRSLRAPGLEIELASGAHSGTVIRLDHESNLVYVDGALPTDGRLDGSVVQFNHPAYSRNTAYTIHRVFKDEGRTVIDLGTQRTVLGQGTVKADSVDATGMVSLAPHPYAQGMRNSGVDFFSGKGVVSADGRHRTRLKSLTSTGQSAQLQVESTQGFGAGDRFSYLDISPDDTYVIHNRATLLSDGTGGVRVRATDDVRITIGGTTEHIPWTE